MGAHRPVFGASQAVGLVSTHEGDGGKAKRRVMTLYSVSATTTVGSGNESAIHRWLDPVRCVCVCVCAQPLVVTGSKSPFFKGSRELLHWSTHTLNGRRRNASFEHSDKHPLPYSGDVHVTIFGLSQLRGNLE